MLGSLRVPTVEAYGLEVTIGSGSHRAMLLDVGDLTRCTISLLVEIL